MALNTERIRNPEIRTYFNDHLNGLCRMIYMGTPIAADTNYIVESANMKVGTYTIAHQPDVARLITITHTAVDTVDTLGTITIAGTNVDGKVISEAVTPLNGTVATTTKAFKTITSITGAGWVQGGTGIDTIIIGVGAILGMLAVVAETGDVVHGVVGTAWVTPANVAVDALVEKCLIDLSAGTYDGSKKVFMLLVE